MGNPSSTGLRAHMVATRLCNEGVAIVDQTRQSPTEVPNSFGAKLLAQSWALFGRGLARTFKDGISLPQNFNSLAHVVDMES